MRRWVRDEPPCRVEDEAAMFRLIRAAFGQRRKTIVNALVGGGYPKEAARAALTAAGISPSARERFAALADAFGRPARNG